MKHLTVALLWLSREMESPLPEQDVRIDDCIREIIGENDYLMEGKQVSLITDLQPVTLRTPPTLAHIILTNLVRNAFQHSCDGEIRISNSPGVIEVANRIHSSGENDTASNDGYGLGLQLSQQLVDKIGWKIEVAEEDGQFLIRVLTSQADTPII
jgi:signal transduction histidine kinase